MGQIVEIARDINEGMRESQHQELEMYRKLGILEIKTIQGKDDEDCELQWIDFAAPPGSGLIVYCAQPGLKNEL